MSRYVPMSFEQAVKEAQKRWGSMSFCRTTVTHVNGDQAELIRTVGTIYNGQLAAIGEGPSWEHAFQDADKADRYAKSPRPGGLPPRAGTWT